VWVRIGGEWRRGRIIEWVRQIDRDGWDCVIMADEQVSGPPWQGRYAFDPRASAPVTRTSHRLIWLVPSNRVSNFHHDQSRTLAVRRRFGWA
jgi:hypothetical protein